MNRQGVRIKLLIIVAFAVIAIIGMGLFGVMNTKRTFESIDQVRGTAEEFQFAAEQITDPLNELRRTVLTMVMAPDRKTQQSYDEKQKALTLKLDKTFNLIKSSQSSEEQQQAFNRLMENWRVYESIKNATVKNVSDGYREEAFINSIQAGDKQFGLVMDDVRKWQQTMIANAKNVERVARDRYDRMWWISAAAIILLSLLVALAGGVAIRTIMRPIQSLKNVATRIADQTSDATLTSALDERIPIHSEDELGAMAVAFNKMVDNLRAAMVRLQSEQNRTQAILNSTADGILTISEKGDIRSTNTAAEHLFKCSAREAVGQNVARFVPALYSDKQAYRNKPISSGERRVLANHVETYGVDKSQQHFPLELRVIELEYGGERLYIATLQDVTERKRVEEEREKIAAAIAGAVNRLSTASQHISQNAAQQTAGAADQAAAVTETSASVNEVARAAGETAVRADEVAKVAGRANEFGLAGREAVAQSIQAMADVRQQVEATATNIAKLSEKAQTIGEITKTVNDIAEQTNVLALNAAVEASRAGEHGKGFAVVASEVKSLALQSKEATKRVRSLLLEIKTATDQSVRSTEEGRKSATEASRIVSEAADTITNLSETLEKSAMSAKQIAATARQQATAVEQVDESIRNISQVTQRNMEAVRQIESAARSLTELSLELSSLTGRRTATRSHESTENTMPFALHD